MRPLSLLPVLLIASGLIVSGCAEHRLTVVRPDPTGGPHLYNSAALGWGVKQKREAAECTTNILHEVRVKQTLGQALASVLTLGLWMPTQIEYICGNIDPPVGDTSK